MTDTLPRIAVLGRPNVGKSTLFNRLAGKPLAIVDDRPGVTRDRREARGKLGDLPLLLIDTAGYDDAEKGGLDQEMRTQTEIAIRDADLCLLLVDGRSGVTPLDESFAEIIRRSGKPVLLLANKCEGKAGEGGLADAFALGMGEPIGVSAAHGQGMGELYDRVVEVLGPKAKAARRVREREDDPPLRIAVIGRPNAGKSTLINQLLQSDRLLTGPEAGITRDSISIDWEWQGRRIRLVDTAGLRRKSRVQEKLERMSTGETIRSLKYADIIALVMDADEAMEKQDLQIADLALREGRGIVLVISKWDLIKDTDGAAKHIRDLSNRLMPNAGGAPIVFLSGLTGRNIEKLMPAVVDVYSNWTARVKTGDLNRWLRHTVERHPPPSVHGKRIKPRYMAQMKARPPTFVLIASRGDQMPDQYKRYLVNGVREAFDMNGVPIRLFVRQGKNPYADKAAQQRPSKRYKPKH